jgi:hypothetical protein
MNVGDGQSIVAQASSQLSAVDTDVRAKHTGKPADDIKPLAILPFRRIGVSLSDAELVAMRARSPAARNTSPALADARWRARTGRPRRAFAAQGLPRYRHRPRVRYRDLPGATKFERVTVDSEYTGC